MILNSKLGGCNNTHIVEVTSDGGYLMKQRDVDQSCILLNILLSEGKQGKVRVEILKFGQLILDFFPG